MSRPEPSPHRPPVSAGPAADGRRPRLREFDSRTLFGPDNEVLIRHDAVLYRLRKTGQGKLILTK
jgi:hemin uptake protein HemP